MQARACVVSAIYEKSLHVSMSEQHGASTGAIVNLMSNDANRIMNIASYGHNLWSAPFQVVTAFTLLMLYIGPSCIVGILVVLISIKYQLLIISVFVCWDIAFVTAAVD